jgi:hypothetical protein
MLRILLLLTFFVSCVEQNPSFTVSEQKIENQLDIEKILDTEIWICHNPGTEFHNELCIEEEPIYPDGCLVKGDNHKFCWSLELTDCVDNSLDYYCQRYFGDLLNNLELETQNKGENNG